MSHIIKGRSLGKTVNIRNIVGCWGLFRGAGPISIPPHPTHTHTFFLMAEIRRKEAVRTSERPC